MADAINIRIVNHGGGASVATSTESLHGVQLPDGTPIGAVADVAFDRIAELVRKVLGVPVGLVSLVDRSQQVFPGQAGLPQPWSESRCTPLTHSFCQHVVRSAQPLVVADARLDPILRSNLATLDIGVVGYAGIPLLDLDGEVAGALCAIDTEPHDWTADEIALLTDLAATCSAELQLRTAASDAQIAQARTRTLLALSEALAKTASILDVSQAIDDVTTGCLGATFGGLTLLDCTSATLTYVDLHDWPGRARADLRSMPLTGRSPSITVAAESRSLYFDTIDAVRSDYPEAAAALAAGPAGAAAYLPLVGTAGVLGTLAALWPTPRTFDTDDRAVLEVLATYTAQAVERAQLLADRRKVAETLQAAMLPALPAVAGFELAGRYEAARISDAVGGDWYDAFSLPDGSLTISVGDVAGHDTEAAAVMGQMRSTMRALAVAVPGQPAQVLQALDHVLASLPPARLATAVLASLARGDDGVTTLSWSNAGHLAPLLVTPGLPSAYLEPTPSLLLGVGPGPLQRAGHVTTLVPGSTLLLYTDGLVERRDVDMDETLAVLADSADRHRDLDLPSMLDAVLGDMISGTHDDDTVLFGVRTVR